MNHVINFKLSIILFLAFLLRLVTLLYFRDLEVDNEWGILLENLEMNNILSVHSVQGVPVPNIFMPPLYPFFLYCLKLIFLDMDIFLLATQFTQILLSVITVYFTFKILKEFFSENITAIGTLIFAIFPLNVYASSQISSITLQVFLLNLFLFSYLQLFKKFTIFQILLFAISSGLLMLLRGEFFIFVLLSMIYLYLQKQNIIKILVICLISILVISPYIYRNYEIFGVITITKSAGYNLLKGNHPNTKAEGTPMFLKVEEVVPEVRFQLENLKSKGPITKYDLYQDEILLNQAIKFIKDDPIKYIKLYILKIFSFALIDLNANYYNYYSPLHTIPKILIGIASLIGIALSFNFRVNILNYISLYYFANIGLFSVFFILPRYSLSLLTIQIILSLIVLKKIKPNL